MRILIGPRDAGDVGEVWPQPGQAFELAAISQVPAKARAVQDHEPAVGVGDEHGAQHRHIWGESGAGRDQQDRLARRHPIQGEHPARLAAEIQPVAVRQREQARRKLAAGDEHEIKLHVPALHTRRRDAVRAPNHLVRFGDGFLRRGFRHARFAAEQTQHRKLAGLEIEHQSVGLDAENQQLRIDFLPSDDGGIVRVFGVSAHVLAGRIWPHRHHPSSAASMKP